MSSTGAEKEGRIRNSNPDIEEFLKKNAIQFAKEKKSITYIVGDKVDGSFLGYFTLAHKPIEIPADGLSKSTKKRIEKHSKLNYSVDEGQRISGNEMKAKRETAWDSILPFSVTSEVD